MVQKELFLHLLPVVGDIDYNQQLIEKSVILAAQKNADWIITPELTISGLQFSKRIGTDWIHQQPDAWTEKEETISFCKAENKVIQNGQVLKHHFPQSAILTFECWDIDQKKLLSTDFKVDYIN